MHILFFTIYILVFCNIMIHTTHWFSGFLHSCNSMWYLTSYNMVQYLYCSNWEKLNLMSVHLMSVLEIPADLSMPPLILNSCLSSHDPAYKYVPALDSCQASCPHASDRTAVPLNGTKTYPSDSCRETKTLRLHTARTSTVTSQHG